ncbi:DUF397 domain-containing protein [Streptomyces chartreusis]|uniref:DUF397 domain-containing protein n=1 Tax=Streptomyces chartreusis TaxID=1969 RepID=UPI00123D1613|nr:DUF397 domain-containing protein [Streptomyces chartreusis]QEV68717.1 DUF397 domain-containing protein [Streptomyces chartreusis]GGX49593.1 hypothetical protein GCM10010321_78110 [Streptomyces chartreusis]
MTGTLRWFKSSFSSDSGGECLEVAPSPHPTPAIHIRDSKNPHGPNLTVSGRAWAAFTSGLPQG